MNRTGPGGAAVAIVKHLARLVADPDAAAPMYPMLLVQEMQTRSWTSATFEGEVHRLELKLVGPVVAVSEAIDRLVDIDPTPINLPGQLVAEVKVTAIGVAPGIDAPVRLVIEALTVID